MVAAGKNSSSSGVGSRRLAAGAILAVALFLVLGWNDRHYWDEYFYLYSAYTHSPAELVRYEQHSTLFPPGFFSEKIGHVAILHAATSLLGAGERVLYLLQGLYALMLVATVVAAWALLRDLFGACLSREASLALAFSPLVLYLAYKTLSEVPSLLLVTVGSWAFVRACLLGRGWRAAGWLGLAVVALAAGMLCRVTTIAAFGALGLGLLAAGDERFGRRAVLTRLVVTAIGVLALHTLGLALAGGTIARVGGHIRNVVGSRSPMQRVYALVCFAQGFALILPFAWRRRRERSVRLAAVWFAAAALPFALGFEPRYYVAAVVPFAVLAAVGLREAAGRGRLALLAVLVLFDRVVFTPLMPYEVEQSNLLTLVRTMRTRDPGSTALIPWISDYSLLRFAEPGAPVELCVSNLPDSRLSTGGHAGALPGADAWWAGPAHYVGSRAALSLEPRPWEYIGWTYNPAVLDLLQLLGRAGLGHRVSTDVQMHNHLTGSWVWHDPSLTPRLVRRRGEYYVYQLRDRG
ncbi:MAG: glycosyltransferase family 39 protein [Gemmatimonadales bacterium]